MAYPDWAPTVSILLTTIGLGLATHALVFRVMIRVWRADSTIVLLLQSARAPTKLLVLLLALLLVMRHTALPDPLVGLLRHLAALLLIGAVAWLIIALIFAAETSLATRFPTDVADNLGARRIRTRVAVLCRIGVAVVTFIAISSMLMTFPSVQHLGTSLLASAGIVGIVAGVAAQRTIGNLIAGLQIALSQPIRLDDVVVIDDEWGRVEDIGTTHVSVRLWDARYLVVPLSYVIERPFENWTRETANILGTVEIATDYTVPVEEMRDELLRVLKESALWDGEVWALQVTGAEARSLQLRALMSARDGPTAWDLRCEVREKLVRFLQERHPESLPRTRVALGTPSLDTQILDTRDGDARADHRGPVK
jgi:small-conductance mechanosensitive channel